MKKKYLIGTGIVLVLLAAILLGAGQYMPVSYTHLTLPTNSRV